MKITSLFALVVAAGSAHGAFVATFNPAILELTPTSPVGSVDLVVTNTGTVTENLSLWSISMFPFGPGASEITLTPPETLNYSDPGNFFFAGPGLAPGASAVLGSFTWAMDPGANPTRDDSLSATYGGSFIYEVTPSSAAVINSPITVEVLGVPEASSSATLLLGLGMLSFRRRRK